MKRLNVRCCCQPMKILGTLPWDETSHAFEFPLIGGGALTLPVCAIQHHAINVPEIAMDDIHPDVAALMLTREPAYKAEGVPLDQLRMIPEFQEGDMVYHFPTSEERVMSANGNNITEIGIGSAMSGRVIDRKIFETPVTIHSELTNFEQTLFNRLAESQGSIVSKEELVKALYPVGEPPLSNGIEVFVRRLRRKLGEHRITTVRSKGYQLNAETPIAITAQAE